MIIQSIPLYYMYIYIYKYSISHEVNFPLIFAAKIFDLRHLQSQLVAATAQLGAGNDLLQTGLGQPVALPPVGLEKLKVGGNGESLIYEKYVKIYGMFFWDL